MRLDVPSPQTLRDSMCAVSRPQPIRDAVDVLVGGSEGHPKLSRYFFRGHARGCQIHDLSLAGGERHVNLRTQSAMTCPQLREGIVGDKTEGRLGLTTEDRVSAKSRKADGPATVPDWKRGHL